MSLTSGEGAQIQTGPRTREITVSHGPLRRTMSRPRAIGTTNRLKSANATVYRDEVFARSRPASDDSNMPAADAPDAHLSYPTAASQTVGRRTRRRHRGPTPAPPSADSTSPPPRKPRSCVAARHLTLRLSTAFVSLDGSGRVGRIEYPTPRPHPVPTTRSADRRPRRLEQLWS
jgi:hypothetical protein